MNTWAADKLDLTESLIESSHALVTDLTHSRPNPSGSIQDMPARHLASLVENFSAAVLDGNEKLVLSFGEDIQTVAEEFELPTALWLELFENVVALFPVDSAALLLAESDHPDIRIQVVDSVQRIMRLVQKDVRNLYSLDPRAFEHLVAGMFEAEGYSTSVTPASRDGGVDIIAIKSHMGIETKHIIECKRYAETNKVGLAIVQRLYGVTISNHANLGIVVTTSSFSKDAIEFSKLHPWHIQLKAKDWLLRWLQK